MRKIDFLSKRTRNISAATHSFQDPSFSNVVDIIILRTGLQYKAMRCIYKHMLTLHGVPTSDSHIVYSNANTPLKPGAHESSQLS